jgi:restriction system protein
MIETQKLKEEISSILKVAQQPLSAKEISRRLLNAQVYHGILQDELQREILKCIDLYQQSFISLELGLIDLNQGLSPNAQNLSQLFDPKIEYYPLQQSIEQLLPILDQKPFIFVKALLKSIKSLIKQQIDLSQPLVWMSQWLKNKNLELGREIYVKSQQQINPAALFELLQFCFLHELIKLELEQILVITQRGYLFLEHKLGVIQQEIDAKEGLYWILMQIAQQKANRYQDLLETWIFENEVPFKKDGFSKKQLEQLLRGRLKNLSDRLLIVKSYQQEYSLSEKGLLYLRDFYLSSSQHEHRQKQLWDLIENQKLLVRKALFDHLSQMNPYDFEVLIAHLLEAMGYEDIEVTQNTHDQGIDVAGSIQIGISAIREVVQVKRNQNHIDRAVLDALRGSLHRFRAVRGTLVALGGFSQGTIEAAFEAGAAPITLIDGEKLLDLLMSHQIGVRKKQISLWQLELDDLNSLSKKDFS